MAYPASTKTLGQWLDDVDRTATNVKLAAQQQNALSLAGNLDMDAIRRFFDQLVQANNFFIAAGAVAGIAAYVNTEKQGQVADAAAEFVAMRGQVVSTLNWLRTNVPEGTFNAVTYKLAFNFPANNTSPSAVLKFTAGETAAYRTVLAALIATIS